MASILSALLSGLRFRARPRIGPFAVNIGRRGVTSISTILGPLTINSRSGKATVNLPGHLSWVGRLRR